jgi:L-cystine uptake protein TcyP (sodium:dicarboxylate symporter family)
MFPLKGWNAELASVYALLYQPMSTSELNSDVMGGVTVDTMAMSKNTRKYAVTIAARIEASLTPCGHACSGAAGGAGGGAGAAAAVSVSVLSFVVSFVESGCECPPVVSFSMSRAIAVSLLGSMLADTLTSKLCGQGGSSKAERKQARSLVKKETEY